MSLSDERIIEIDDQDDNLAHLALQVLKTFDALPTGAIVQRRKQRTSFICTTCQFEIIM